MNVERLKHLIEVMRRVERDEKPLEMSTWIDEQPHGHINNEEELCKTAKCCLGWACFDPTFREQGLGIVLHERHVARWTPVYKGVHGFAAGGEFFDITPGEAYHIFDPNEYKDDEYKDVDEVTPQDVIEHIYDVIEGNVPEEDKGGLL
jgi:hypothetical protein